MLIHSQGQMLLLEGAGVAMVMFSRISVCLLPPASDRDVIDCEKPQRSLYTPLESSVTVMDSFVWGGYAWAALSINMTMQI